VACFAVELAVRETVPGRSIRWLTSLGGGATCSSWSYTGTTWYRDGQPYENGTLFRLPASGGSSRITLAPRFSELTESGSSIPHAEVMAELQVRVVRVP
jgi:hypothetical protein